MLGHPALPCHLEFTSQPGHDFGRAPTQDNLLVFYLPDEKGWEAAVQKMVNTGFGAVRSVNPYWDAEGERKTFEDADGWNIVLWNGEWNMDKKDTAEDEDGVITT
jgi:hypothetical protein